MTEHTIKCRICGRPYKFYAHKCGDQSACPACIRAAEKEIQQDWVKNPNRLYKT
jgi:hypothetical protein